MLITKLTLNNFRVFRGVHEIDLRPTPESFDRSKQPIILFGGLNGAGKTSILSAVRLVLFGRQSFNQMLTNNDYINELNELIHKGAGTISQPDSASIQLEFQYSQNGEESTYKVIRGWKRGQKDKLYLEKDGVALTELDYDQCQGFLNELIPTGIADLFFFDGEKIAELAEDESGTVLKTAVRRLLGLDVIAKLKSDLNIFLKKQGASSLSHSIQEEMEALDQKRIHHERAAEKLRFHAENDIYTQIEHTSAEIQNLENKLSQNGGGLGKNSAGRAKQSR
ncbi:AAA family ATPase [Vibrio aestuarianus]|nr:AAA family ATPase [Vibrio aestuarianus]